MPRPPIGARLIGRFADLVEAHGDELAELESLDNGKPVKLAKIVDVAGTVAHLRHFAGWPERIFGTTIPVRQPDMHVYTRKEPVGVCGQIIPWNFPMLMAAWKLGPALAAGCTVVLKPAEQTPLTALRLGELALEAGFPAGVLNVVTGDGSTGAALVDHPGVDKIAFTGSTEVGREIGAKAGRALKRVTLELGGKSPNIILPDADLNAAIAGSFNAIYFNTGQACNAGSRLFVHADQFDEVVSGLADRAAKTRLGPGLEPGTQLGPVVSAGAARAGAGYIESGRSEGAELVTGGESSRFWWSGYFVAPTLFTADQRRSENRPRGDLRSRARRAALRVARGGRGARQRHRIRPRRRGVDARRRQRPQACCVAERRLGIRQHLGRQRPRRPVRWLQGLRHRPRARP